MKFKDVMGLSPEEKKRKLIDLRKELFDAKMKNTLGQLGNTLSIRNLRRDVARIKTALSQKQG